MSDALPLPPRPNLEQYKKLAREFQALCNNGDENAQLEWIVRWSENLATLRGIAPVEDTRRTIRAEALRILERFRRTSKARENANCTLSQAQFFIALAHGFSSWPTFSRHVQELSRASSTPAIFEAAADAIVDGDLATLTRLLREHPNLVRERSTRDHNSTLLHYVSANGIEDFRQKTPANIVEIARVLLDAGAEVNAESEAYGGGSTTLGLVATSIHPEKAGVQIPLLELLLDRGAYIDKPGQTGNRHNAVGGCLANGQGRAARFFAERGALINLEEAAGVGYLDVMKAFFDESGKLKPPATQQQMESGFLYACGYGYPNVVEFLLAKGVDAGTRNQAGETGLHWVAFGPHIAIAKLLLQHHAPIHIRDRRHEGTPLDWALHGWLQSRSAEDRERSYELIELLVRAGATFDPAQWADETGLSAMARKIHADPRMSALLMPAP